MDNLYLSAKAFENLLNKSYQLVLGYKANSINIKINFNRSHFKHLSGLHKLKDINISGYDPNILFENIINKIITFSDVGKSIYFDNISKRLDDFKNLEKYLDNCTDIFGWS